MIPVHVIHVDKGAALVEWADESGKPRRAIIPQEAIEDQAVDPDVLDQGIPYGTAWEDLEIPPVTSEDLAAALRNANVWTVEDAKAHPKAVLAALQAVYQIDLDTILTFGKE